MAEKAIGAGGGESSARARSESGVTSSDVALLIATFVAAFWIVMKLADRFVPPPNR